MSKAIQQRQSLWPLAAGAAEGAVPAARLALQAAFALAGAAALLAALWLTREILLVIFGGILLGVFYCGLTKVVTKYTRLPRGVALTLVLGALTLLTIGGFLLLGSEIVAQLGELGRGLSKAYEQMKSLVRDSPLAEWVALDRQGARPPVSQFGALAGYVTSGAGALAAPLMILVIGLFLAVNPGLYRRGLLQLVPREERPRAENILDRSEAALWAWLWGRVFSMSLIGVATFVGLWLLGIPIALSLALIAFVANFIPYLGPALSAIPAVLIALTIGPMHAIYVLLLYGGIQLVETNFITPLVEQQAVNLPPAFTIAAQMISGVLFGPLGILLATPLSAVAVVLVKSLYIEGILGEPEEKLAPGGEGE